LTPGPDVDRVVGVAVGKGVLIVDVGERLPQLWTMFQCLAEKCLLNLRRIHFACRTTKCPKMMVLPITFRFAYWALVYFGQFFETGRRNKKFWATFFDCKSYVYTYVLTLSKQRFGYNFGVYSLVRSHCPRV
jgi:hypothetical protein